MAARLLSHAQGSAVSSTPASRLSPSRMSTVRRAAPPFSNGTVATSREASASSTSSSDKDKDKVLCVCGVTTNDGKPMVECVRCCAWSHLQCVRLTQRTAKKVMFQCHRCKGQPVNKPSVSKPPVTKPSVSGKTRVWGVFQIALPSKEGRVLGHHREISMLVLPRLLLFNHLFPLPIYLQHAHNWCIHPLLQLHY